MKKKLSLGSAIVIALLLILYFVIPGPEPVELPVISLEQVPVYSGEPFVVLENNVPQFSEKDNR